MSRRPPADALDPLAPGEPKAASAYGDNIQARARALAERTIRHSRFANPQRHRESDARLKRDGEPPMPPLMTEAQIAAYIEEYWPTYAEVVESGAAATILGEEV